MHNLITYHNKKSLIIIFVIFKSMYNNFLYLWNDKPSYLLSFFVLLNSILRHNIEVQWVVNAIVLDQIDHLFKLQMPKWLICHLSKTSDNCSTAQTIQATCTTLWDNHLAFLNFIFCLVHYITFLRIFIVPRPSFCDKTVLQDSRVIFNPENYTIH